MGGKVFIGTSGWNYKHWLGPFYPEKTRAADMLRFYAKYFDTVEINATHYHLPSFKTFDSWRETVPAQFVFAVKASRFITHIKKLKAPRTSTEKFLLRVKNLQKRLAQFSSNFRRDGGSMSSVWNIFFQHCRTNTAIPSSFPFTAGTKKRFTSYSRSIVLHCVSIIKRAMTHR